MVIVALALGLTGCVCREWGGVLEDECIRKPAIENGRTSNLPGRNVSQGSVNEEQRARNSVYLELLGNGGMYSVNFEREILPRLGLRVGAATWSNDGDYIFESTNTRTLTTFPLMLNYSVGRGSNRLEVGGGLLLGQSRRTEWDEETSSGIRTLTGTIGYRYQPERGGFLFRAGLVPFYSLNSDEEAYPDAGFFPSLGVSGGYAF